MVGEQDKVQVPVQVVPFPAYPSWQVQLYEPTMLVQYALGSQSVIPAAHSSKSKKEERYYEFTSLITLVSRYRNVKAFKLSIASHSLHQQWLASVLSRELWAFSHVSTSTTFTTPQYLLKQKYKCFRRRYFLNYCLEKRWYYIDLIKLFRLLVSQSRQYCGRYYYNQVKIYETLHLLAMLKRLFGLHFEVATDNASVMYRIDPSTVF